jgi:hypothetical protein
MAHSAAARCWRAVYVPAIDHRLFTTRLRVLGSGEQSDSIVRELDRLRDSGCAVIVQVAEAPSPCRPPCPAHPSAPTDSSQLFHRSATRPAAALCVQRLYGRYATIVGTATQGRPFVVSHDARSVTMAPDRRS